MVDSSAFTPPDNWEISRMSQPNARFRNESKGLDVSIRGVSRGSNRRRRGPPTHYTVQVHQDWWGKGVLGDIDMSTKVDTYEQAIETAREFMEEFVDEEARQSASNVQAAHQSVGGDHDLAESVLTTELAAEALADAAGYSDDLLLKIIRGETNDKQRAVGHRVGDTLDIIYCADDFDAEEQLLSLYAAFPIDLAGINHILNDRTPLRMTLDLDDETIYRFIYDERTETNIIVPHGAQIASGFEQTVANVLEEKWD